MRHPPPAAALRQARLQMLENGQPPGGVDERVVRSWQRCLNAGLRPTGRLEPVEHRSGSQLAQTLAANHELLAHSHPVMEYLFEQVRHSQSVVVLADQRGTLMHTLGDAHFAGKAARVALSSGASWHESQRGTNAIGTALADACPVEIHGAEHFLERNSFLTCAAAPIVSATGQLLGILDISSEQRSGHPHTLGLVATAARMIENRLLDATCRRHIRLHIHPQPEGIGTVAEGIVAVSEDGWIVGANRKGLALLGLSAGQIGGAAIDSVLDMSWPQLLSRQQRQLMQSSRVQRHDGSTLFVQVHMSASVLASPPALGTSARPATTPQALATPQTTPDDALAALDSGDARWRAAADKARRVLGKPIALLVQGESGVGKEIFARATHDSGPRRQGPFVAINCAAIPEHLIEAELFGHEPGAFTGARREGRIGRLREAHGGTLFLDEIGDMPLAMQTRLLRVLQERQVTPLGSGQAVDVDFALVCATHRKLKEEADKGSFRSDLYYRINGLTVHLPALRERTDFAALVERMLASLNPGRNVQIDADLLAQLAHHPWPGNLRQCASVLRTSSAMLADDEDCIERHHLADDVLEDLQALTSPTPNPRPSSAADCPASERPLGARNLDELTRSAIQQALESSRGNISLAARCLGISRQTLYRHLKAGQTPSA